MKTIYDQYGDGLEVSGDGEYVYVEAAPSYKEFYQRDAVDSWQFTPEAARGLAKALEREARLVEKVRAWVRKAGAVEEVQA